MLINREFLPNLANINKQNSSKDTPLHVACSKGQFKVVEYLVHRNAKVNIKGHKDYTPLHIAVSKGHTSIVKLLIARGSNVNQSAKDHWKPIHIAATLDLEAIVEILISSGAAINTKKNSPLHVAISNNALKAAIAFIRHGANIDGEDHRDQTPLEVAIEKNRFNPT